MNKKLDFTNLDEKEELVASEKQESKRRSVKERFGEVEEEKKTWRRGPKAIPRKKALIQLPADLFDEVDAHCEKTGISRAAFFTQLAAEKLRKAEN